MESLKKKLQECPICFGDVDNADEYTLSTCKHLVHKVCLEKYLEYAIIQKRIPIRCPIENCMAQPPNEEIKQLVISEKLGQFEKVLVEQQVIMDPNMQWCPTPDCDTVLIQKENKLQCQKCNKNYCFLCQMDQHEGKCPEDANLKLAIQNNFKKCPGCQAYVEKMHGCSYISCICGMKWCFTCEVPYVKTGCPKCKSQHVLNEINRPQIIQNIPDADFDIMQMMEFIPEVLDYKRLLAKRQKLLREKQELEKLKMSMTTDDYVMAMGKIEFNLVKVKTDLYRAYVAKNIRFQEIKDRILGKKQVFGGKKKKVPAQKRKN